MAEFPRMIDFGFVKLASEWHGGQTSALYSLASTGKIHSADHASDVLTEAHNAANAATRTDARKLRYLSEACERILREMTPHYVSRRNGYEVTLYCGTSSEFLQGDDAAEFLERAETTHEGFTDADLVREYF